MIELMELNWNFPSPNPHPLQKKFEKQIIIINWNQQQ